VSILPLTLGLYVLDQYIGEGMLQQDCNCVMLRWLRHPPRIGEHS